MYYFRSFSVTLLFLHGLSTTTSQSISTLAGSQVELTCNYRVQGTGIILWTRNHGSLRLSENTQIYDTELRQRLNITGNHDIGEYNLMISGVNKTDQGRYECRINGEVTNEQFYELVVIDGPTSVLIPNKQNNRLRGTEGQDLLITCTANGGDPAPNMVLMVGSENYTSRNTHRIEQTITRISRSYDGVTVSCQAGYDGVMYTPLTDTAVIRLDLKPLPPSFSMNPVVTEATKNLVITCTSTGSRPAPSDRIWLIGNSNVDITSSSTNISSLLQPNDTYTATSTLTFKVAKNYNLQNLTCGFKNTATENNFIQITTKMNVTYAPTLSVQNRTFPLNQTVREVHCNIDGNPNSTYIKWQHKSSYGVVIREFNQVKTLVLPEQTEDNRYQDTGEYVCKASNGIRDEYGNLNQNTSGYVVSEAPPRSLQGSYQEALGQYRHDVTLSVSIYSVPKYTSLTWLRDGSVISQSGKYIMADVPDIITDVFYDIEVQVDCFKLALTITKLEQRDVANYTLRLSNGINGTLQHYISLKSGSPPETPGNFTLLSSTESSITLQWVSSFDGGHEQTFFVEYRTSAHIDWTIVEVPKVIQTARDDILTYTLTGLQASTEYEVRMYAKNKLKKSNSTDIVTIATTEKSGLSAVIGAVVGVLTAVVVVVIIVVVIFKTRRRSDKDDKRKIKRREPSFEGEYGLKDNILYQSVDSENKPQEPIVYAEVHKSNAVYAEVQKPNAVYAEVKKSGPQKKAKEKNKKGVDNSSFEEYANAENRTGGYKNADGLKYVDVRFSNPPKGGKPVIHGLDERTIYSDVDHKKKAPPQEGAYELTDISHGK